MALKIGLEKYKKEIAFLDLLKPIGKVTEVVGLTVEAKGIGVPVGEICFLETGGTNQGVEAEVVGFREEKTLLMPLGEITGVRPGSRVFPRRKVLGVKVGPELLGRIVNGLGEPLDKKPFLLSGEGYPVNNAPPCPLARQRIQKVLATGIKAIDSLITCGQGQRLGIFAGSGVGKSTLLGMIARYSTADVNVVALIGERGREVLDFIQKDLGPEGLQKSVVVVATADQPALIRIKGAFVATSIAEYFRDQGKNVLLMMDSLTRFAMAQREVGLAIGEPPTSRGYTPSVFTLLPKLLERAGNTETGSITGLYTVLVDADDLNEPITDAARAVLDGHIVLSRELAHRNHFPAIDVLNSVSRLMPEIVTPEHLELAGKLRDLLAAYQEAEDLIQIGAYQRGTNPRVDAALKYYDAILTFLQQKIGEHFSWEECLALLAQTLAE